MGVFNNNNFPLEEIEHLGLGYNANYYSVDSCGVEELFSDQQSMLNLGEYEKHLQYKEWHKVTIKLYKTCLIEKNN